MSKLSSRLQGDYQLTGKPANQQNAIGSSSQLVGRDPHISDSLHIRYSHYNSYQYQNCSYGVATKEFYVGGHHSMRTCAEGHCVRRSLL